MLIQKFKLHDPELNEGAEELSKELDKHQKKKQEDDDGWGTEEEEEVSGDENMEKQ